MGSQNSKDGSDHSDGALSTISDALKGALPTKAHFPGINPGVAVHTLWKHPNKAGQRALKGGAHHLRNIFAAPLDFAKFTPAVFPKSIAEKQFIRNALRHNFVFEGISRDSLAPLIEAFEKVSADANQVLITQGDQVGDYFYVLQTGECSFLVNQEAVGTAGPGDSFGELALLYTCPRAATVTTVTASTLFRVDQKSFRYLLRQQTVHNKQTKVDLLMSVPFCKDLDPSDVKKLADCMVPRAFTAGQDFSVRKGDAGALPYFYVVSSGSVKVTNVVIGGASFEDMVLGPGDFGGGHAIMEGAVAEGDAVAETDGMLFVIDQETFANVMGQHSALVLRSNDTKVLNKIKPIKDSNLDSRVLILLADMIVDREFQEGVAINRLGKLAPAALFIVRKGKVTLTSADGSVKEVIGAGGYFGQEQLLADATSKKNSPRDPSTIVAEYNVTATEASTIGVLRLLSCRKVMDTIYMGKPRTLGHLDSIVDKDIGLKDLQRHCILGAGTFGQVWLVSRNRPDGGRAAYALKVQSKYELCECGQAKAVVSEKNIMAQLQHPFLSSLMGSFQDANLVYMLMGLVQGGELHSVIHTAKRDHLTESEAKFYTAGVAEGLAYMHRRGYVYRDLKPENVLVDGEGYTVIVDFGFVKFVTEKTFTLCGTPLYMSPEVILARGHNWGADHWSLGCLLYEMLTGGTPFYDDGMDQMQLFKAIIKGKYSMPRGISKDACAMLKGLLKTVPKYRLGSLARGEQDIYDHPWLASIDFEALRLKEIKAPFVPEIKDPLDASNFGDWRHVDDKLKKKFPQIDAKHQAIFHAF